MLLDFPPPANWQDFERLTRAACSLEWSDDEAVTVGSPGQAQNGVDVVGWDNRKSPLWFRVGVQCKRRSNRTAEGVVLAGGVIKFLDFKSELEKTNVVTPALAQFVMATTASQDASLQSEVAMLDQERRELNECGVSIWFWEWFQQQLNRHAGLAHEHYRDYVTHQQEYSPAKLVADVMKVGFDRPLMRTPFHGENSLLAVEDGIKRLQQFISTGKLKDAEGETVASAPIPRRLVDSTDQAVIGEIERGLEQLRSEFTRSVSKGLITQGQGYLEIRDGRVVQAMNAQRAEILIQVNGFLERQDVTSIASPLLKE